MVLLLTIILLDFDGMIGHKNALPNQHKKSIFVMKCPLPAYDAKEESSANKSTSDSEE